MDEKGIKQISLLTDIKATRVKAVLDLFDEGGTVPFIARYRKEATGEMDEVQITLIRDTRDSWLELDKRRQAILKSLTERELLTPALEAAVQAAGNLTTLEDIYLPYRPKKRTRGMIAREAGLLPLAEWLLKEATGASLDAPIRTGHGTGATAGQVKKRAEGFINPEKKIETFEDALAGARDILAEVFNENGEIRKELREIFMRRALLVSRAAPVKKSSSSGSSEGKSSGASKHVASSRKTDSEKYKDYFEWTEPVSRAPSHRILAVLRGTAEGYLTSHFLPLEEDIIPYSLALITGRRGKHSGSSSGPGQVSESAGGNALGQICMAAEDSYHRLTAPSLENEMKKSAKERADREAITVFAENLRELLLASPLGQKRTLALDPGLRTGCKLVCLSDKGDLLHHDVIYPLVPHNKTRESTEIIRSLCAKYDIQAVAVGNGTGGREAEEFAKSALEGVVNSAGQAPSVIMVNESGASVYSASPEARKEFPREDVTVRGAVSIGRRLMDPLAELVKIDPKSIGVGQYQHDVDQKALQKSLDDVVLSCVNSVGVDLNTASGKLLSYVSGISAKTADAITARREEFGAFERRGDLKKVPGLGPKAFEQSAGFLRIRGGKNPLDGSAVHPESYSVVQKMAKDLGTTTALLMEDSSLRHKIKLDDYVTKSTGMPTLRDIMAELEKPGRDPRAAFEIFSFAPDIHTPEDLAPGMVLPGIVTNVTAFGAFVDVGVHQDGLVHISQLSDSFVKDPSEFVKVNQKVKVKVLEVDLGRKRIGLSMKGL
ncbi:MAG: RNA-binding transcriptional accessory protein [Spirochaetales bacterium]|nr:RNA-binding transcriptional accessory protein [Spirochaetales bacterium]